MKARRMATAGEAARPTSRLILTTALDLFSKMGYEATSMREIASAVGVKPASLYNHYPSKEEILWEIVQNALSEILQRQARALSENGDPTSRLRGFVRMHAEFHARESQAAKIVNHNLSSLSPPHYRRTTKDRHRYELRFRDLLEAGVAAGVFDIPDTRITSFAILEMGMGIALWYRPDGSLSVEELAELHVQLALRMVGCPTGSQRSSE